MKQNAISLRKLPKESERSGSNKLATCFAKASAVTAAKMLDFVREMSLGTEEFTQRQSDYWIFVLQDYPPALIERAFHQWVKQSKHMPVPSEIIAILDAKVEAEHREQSAEETNRYLVEMRDARQRLAASGEPHGEAQYQKLMKRALETVKNFPTLPDPNRPLTFKQRLAQAQQERGQSRKPTVHAEPALVANKRIG